MTDTENESIAIVSTEPQPTEDIKGLILTVRGRQVLLDSDVARLYGYETMRINEAARRNIKRFPPDFRFQLTREEAAVILESQRVPLNGLIDSDGLISQFAISSSISDFQHGGRRKLPYAYTEQGIGMLSGLLRNDTAIQVSIGIMNAFVEMRHFIGANRDVFANIATLNNRLTGIDERLQEYDVRFDEVFDLLQAPGAIRQSIFFGGQFYDAFALIIDIIQKARTRITVIDNYADNSVLAMLAHKHREVAVTIITAHPGKLDRLYLEKFQKQYGDIAVVKSTDFHDRFVIIDKQEVYAFGASLKDAGNKCFAVSKNEDVVRFLAFVEGLK